MQISIPWIIVLVSAVLAIVSACLLSVWAGFGIFLGIFLLIASGTFTYIRYMRHRALKEELQNQRYCDAYMYADENELSLDVEHFRYPHKQERAIKNKTNNSLVLVLAGVAMIILSIVIIVIAATNL